jgi:hypothetical protein
MKKAMPGKTAAEVSAKSAGASASVLIDEKIKELGDWRGKMLAKVRGVIHAADPEIVEEWKWMGLLCSRTTASCARERRTRAL